MIKRIALLAAALSAAAPAALSAQTCSFFGALPVATFGGSGIPNTSVAVNNCLNGVTLGLSAAARLDNATVTDNGAGTFYAQAGADVSASPVAGYTTWNFNWYVGGTSASQYTYYMYWDIDPVSGNTPTMGTVLNAGPIFPAGSQNSWNLGMGFIDQNGALAPNFNLNAAGEYTFNLVAKNVDGAEVARSSITVVTRSSTVPEPSTYALMAAGLAGLVAVRRRRARSA